LIPGKDARDIPAIFIMNENSEASQLAIALQGSGRGAIVVEGRASDLGAVQTARLELGEGVTARVRMTELLSQDGSVGITPDALVPAGADEEALARALALARDFQPSHSVRPRAPASGVIQDENSYPGLRYPSREYRLLGAIRVWNVFRYFFAYQSLTGEDWEAVLRQFITRVEDAKNELDYNLAMAEMVSLSHDAHVGVNRPTISRYFAAIPPIIVRYIEGEAVVTGFREQIIAKTSGIAIGDVIVKLDGEDARVLLQHPRMAVAAATEQALYRTAAARMLAGPADSTATLVVRNSSGVEREIELPRTIRIPPPALAQRTGEIVKILPGNIGYADLDRLEAKDVDAMFEQFKGTRGIIFDMRGYPKGAPWSIAPRLSGESLAKTAINSIPLVIGLERPVFQEIGIADSASFYSTIAGDAGKPRYTGLTVMLIDERTQSAAEQTGLMFEAVNGTKFIGSPSAGTNGGITAVTAPGGIIITFSGTDVRHADGRQLQRIGLQPDLSVSPTIAGIRRGQDEVLERAIEYVNQHAGAR
jgi:C-terminal processing protease CtpA/Prc